MTKKAKTIRPEVDFCNICGTKAELTEDHIPPQSCGNKHSIKVRDFFDAEKRFAISQNGFKNKTICGKCNNERLGLDLDLELKNFFEAIRLHVESVRSPRSIVFMGQKVYIPNKVKIKCKVNKIIKAILCRFLAAKNEFDDVCKIDNDIRKFVLKNDVVALADYSLLFWIYGYDTIIVARDATVHAVGNSEIKRPQGILSGLFFYPAAFIFADKNNENDMSDLLQYLQQNDDDEVEIIIDLHSFLFRNCERIPNGYPFNIDDSHIILLSDNSDTFFGEKHMGKKK